jgi:hypothetical protein
MAPATVAFPVGLLTDTFFLPAPFLLFAGGIADVKSRTRKREESEFEALQRAAEARESMNDGRRV